MVVIRKKIQYNKENAVGFDMEKGGSIPRQKRRTRKDKQRFAESFQKLLAYAEGRKQRLECIIRFEDI